MSGGFISKVTMAGLAYRFAIRLFGFVISAGLSVPVFAQSPPHSLDWQPRQDDRYVVEASYSGLEKVSGSNAEAAIKLRLQWWGLLGQPVETYSMQWGVSKAFAEEGELLEPFAQRLPNNGDFSGNPEVVAQFAKLRSTDVALRIHFYIRAPKDAIKGENFYQNCDARFCYAQGTRDLDRLDLPMGPINRWNSEISPKTPIDYKMADWRVGCRVTVVECQRNTLRAGTDMAIFKIDLWKLAYDHTTAKSIVAKWAASALEESPEAEQFRASLNEIVQPFQARVTDPELSATNAFIYYGEQLVKANSLSKQANALDKAVWESGNRSGEKKYARELQKAEREISLLRTEASKALARARAGTDLTDAQIADLRMLEQDFARQELALTSRDNPVTETDEAGLQRVLAEKQAALNAARGKLKSAGEQLDAKKRAWGAYDGEASHANRANTLAGSLQSDIGLISRKLAELDRDKREKVEEESDDRGEERLAVNDGQSSEPRKDDFWSDDSGSEKMVVSGKDDDFWSGGSAAKKAQIGYDRNRLMGVSDSEGNVLIPYRDWHVDSYEAGIAKVTITKSLGCVKLPPPPCRGGPNTSCISIPRSECKYEISRLLVGEEGETLAVISKSIKRSGY